MLVSCNPRLRKTVEQKNDSQMAMSLEDQEEDLQSAIEILQKEYPPEQFVAFEQLGTFRLEEPVAHDTHARGKRQAESQWGSWKTAFRAAGQAPLLHCHTQERPLQAETSPDFLFKLEVPSVPWAAGGSRSTGRGRSCVDFEAVCAVVSAEASDHTLETLLAWVRSGRGFARRRWQMLHPRPAQRRETCWLQGPLTLPGM